MRYVLLVLLLTGCAATLPSAPRMESAIKVLSVQEVERLCGNPFGCVRIYYCERKCDVVVSDESLASPAQVAKCQAAAEQPYYLSTRDRCPQ